MKSDLPELCHQDGCRREARHTGKCDRFPTEAWGFLQQRDKNKLTKAGWATPRGGDKGAYQNHVGRSAKVIIPYERFAGIDPTVYTDGYVVRLFPEQDFEAANTPKA